MEKKFSSAAKHSAHLLAWMINAKVSVDEALHKLFIIQP
jgi:hypothetical protein